MVADATYFSAPESGNHVRMKSALSGFGVMRMSSKPATRRRARSVSTLAVLHLPSFADDIAEPVPGLTPFGYGAGIPYDARTRVWGIYADALMAELACAPCAPGAMQ
jgi:hypothetical protein